MPMWINYIFFLKGAARVRKPGIPRQKPLGGTGRSDAVLDPGSILPNEALIGYM